MSQDFNSIVEPEKLKIIRIPSPGTMFVLGDFKFEVIKTSGRSFKAKGRLKDNKIKKIIRRGDTFILYGNRFKILNDFRMTKGVVKISVVAHDKEEDER